MGCNLSLNLYSPLSYLQAVDSMVKVLKTGRRLLLINKQQTVFSITISLVYAINF